MKKVLFISLGCDKNLADSEEMLGMLVERISYENDKVVEFSKSVSPSYKFKHHVVLNR